VRLTGKSLLENPSEPSKTGTLAATQTPLPAANATVPTLDKVKAWFKQLKPGK
jgi:hypothetical protein